MIPTPLGAPFGAGARAIRPCLCNILGRFYDPYSDLDLRPASSDQTDCRRLSRRHHQKSSREGVVGAEIQVVQVARIQSRRCSGS